MEKRYWANVSEVFFAEPRRRAKRAEKDEERIRIKFCSEAAHREPLRILARERHLCRRL